MSNKTCEKFEGAEGKAKGLHASRETCTMPDRIDSDHQTPLKSTMPADVSGLSITALQCKTRPMGRPRPIANLRGQ